MRIRPRDSRAERARALRRRAPQRRGSPTEHPTQRGIPAGPLSLALFRFRARTPSTKRPPLRGRPPSRTSRTSRSSRAWAALGGGWTRRRVQTRTRTANSPSLRSFANLARRVSRRPTVSTRVKRVDRRFRRSPRNASSRRPRNSLSTPRVQIRVPARHAATSEMTRPPNHTSV